MSSLKNSLTKSALSRSQLNFDPMYSKSALKEKIKEGKFQIQTSKSDLNKVSKGMKAAYLANANSEQKMADLLVNLI